MDWRENGKKAVLSSAVGLVMGPLIGLWLIRIWNVAYLETVFALNCIVVGIGIGFVASLVIVTFLGEHVLSLHWNMAWTLVVLALIINIVEVVIMLRRIIP